MLSYVAVATVDGFAFGFGLGLEKRQPPVTVLAYCALPGNHDQGTPPCPPEPHTLVWAAWQPGIRIPATWTGTHWRLSQPVMGISTTTVPPVAWGPM